MAFIPYGKRDGYLLNSIPRALQERLASETTKRDMSLANLVGEVLSERYGLDFSHSDRPLKSDFTVGESFFVKLPSTVMDAVRQEADLRHLSMRSVFIVALSEAFGLEAPSLTRVDPLRRPGRPRTRHGRPKGRRKVK